MIKRMLEDITCNEKSSSTNPIKQIGDKYLDSGRNVS